MPDIEDVPALTSEAPAVEPEVIAPAPPPAPEPEVIEPLREAVILTPGDVGSIPSTIFHDVPAQEVVQPPPAPEEPIPAVWEPAPSMQPTGPSPEELHVARVLRIRELAFGGVLADPLFRVLLPFNDANAAVVQSLTSVTEHLG